MRGTTLVLLCWITAISTLGYGEAKSSMKRQPFGKTGDGEPVELFVLSNGKGMEVAITNFGGIVVALKVPDRKGKSDDIVLGYDNLEGYLADKAYLGAIIGRYGNRIAHGRFEINGTTYNLPKNNGDNTLHGGLRGFNAHVWAAKDVSTPGTPGLELTYVSKDGEEGFPGSVTATVTYTVTESNELRIDYVATTDKATIINLTNHSYFNLAGQGQGDILKHQLTIHAGRFTPVDAGLIPTGELRPVKGTPFDFNKATAIGERIEQDDEQLKIGMGYDHNWVLDGGITKSPRLAAEAYDSGTGRVLQVLTTEPGVQFYTGNFLDASIRGKGGKSYGRRFAFCLETQHYPDSPNHPNFPTTLLKPGEHYRTTTIFKFLTR